MIQMEAIFTFTNDYIPKNHLLYMKTALFLCIYSL